MSPAKTIATACLALTTACAAVPRGQPMEPAQLQEATIYQTWGGILLASGLIAVGSAGAGAAVIDSSNLPGVSAAPMLAPAAIGLASVIIGGVMIGHGNSVIREPQLDPNIETWRSTAASPQSSPEDLYWHGCWARCDALRDHGFAGRAMEEKVSTCKLGCGERPSVALARRSLGRPAWSSADGRCFDATWKQVACPGEKAAQDLCFDAIGKRVRCKSMPDVETVECSDAHGRRSQCAKPILATSTSTVAR